LPPAVNHITAGNRAPDARRPEIMFIEQIHASTIWRNLPPLASFSGDGRGKFCSGGHLCLPYPAASCRLGRNTEPSHDLASTSDHPAGSRAMRQPGWMPLWGQFPLQNPFPQRASWLWSGVVVNLCREPVLQGQP
jgi:hypothetical protein